MASSARGSGGASSPLGTVDLARPRTAPFGPTLGSIAREVGVDLSLVSRVLRGDPAARVSAEKRDHILTVARESGYRPNRVARSLRTGRTSILGMLTPDITNPFHSILFRGAEAAARLAGFDTILVNTDDSHTRFREVVSVLAEGHVDGLLVATAYAQDEAVEWLAKIDLPYQLMNRRRATETDAWVGPDDFKTGRLGGDHLVRLGHRRIAFLMADLDVWNHRRRIEGFQSAMAEHDIPASDCIFGTGLSTRESGRDFLTRLVNLPSSARPTAIFAPQTILSQTAVLSAYRAGLRVPEDISIIGYTGSNDPEITSIVAPVEEVGREAVRRLIARLSGADRSITDGMLTLDVALIERGTTGPAPDGKGGRSRRATGRPRPGRVG